MCLINLEYLDLIMKFPSKDYWYLIHLIKSLFFGNDFENNHSNWMLYNIFFLFKGLHRQTL